MPEQVYEDFDVQIELIEGWMYRIQVLASPAGEGETVAKFPFDEMALDRYLLELENALLKSATRTRSTPYPSENKVRTFGGKLFSFLTHGEVGQLYAASPADLLPLDVENEKARVEAELAAAGLLELTWLNGQYAGCFAPLRLAWAGAKRRVGGDWVGC